MIISNLTLLEHTSAQLEESIHKRLAFNRLICVEHIFLFSWVFANVFTKFGKTFYPSSLYEIIIMSLVMVLLVYVIQIHKWSGYEKSNFMCIVNSITIDKDIRLLMHLVRGVQAFYPVKLDGMEEQIIDILHCVTQDDIGVLTNKEQQNLWFLGFHQHGVKNPPFSSRLSMALLPALAKIGNEEMFQNMRNLAERSRLRWEWEELPLIELARQQLPGMEMRLRQQRKFETLLRPSAPITLPDMLLRPVVGSVQAAPEEEQQLLRPTDEH